MSFDTQLVDMPLEEPGTPTEGAVVDPFEDYSELWSGHIQVEKPTVGTFGRGKALFYVGAVNCIYCEPGKGKTWLSAYIAKEHIENGGTVIFIDPESTAKRVIRRMKFLGTDITLGKRSFKYTCATDPKKIREYQAWAEGRENVLLIYDGLANPIASAGQDENGNGALKILQEHVKPFADSGATCLVIDHCGKNEKKGLRGFSGKLGFYKGAVYQIEVGTPFAPGIDGYLRLRLDKDNEGGTMVTVGTLAAEFHHVTEENGRGRFELREATEDLGRPGAKPKMSDEEILKALPVGEERAMNFDNIAPALNIKTFTKRCRAIHGVVVELRKGAKGQEQNFFWRTSTDES